MTTFNVGSIAFDKERHLYYIFHFEPNSKKKLGWLRFDTLMDGTWEKHKSKRSEISKLKILPSNLAKELISTTKKLVGFQVCLDLKHV